MRAAARLSFQGRPTSGPPLLRSNHRFQRILRFHEVSSIFFLRLGDVIFVIELGLTVNLEIVCFTVDGLIIIGGDDRIEKYVIYYINV